MKKCGRDDVQILPPFWVLKFCTTTPGKENFVLVHLVVHKLIEPFIVFCCSLISGLRDFRHKYLNTSIKLTLIRWFLEHKSTITFYVFVMLHCFPLETIRPVKLNIDSLSTNRSIKI